MDTLNHDRDLIKNLGGVTKVAQLLGYDKAGGAQRVQNWTNRGIPPSIKISRPDLFMPELELRSAK